MSSALNIQVLEHLKAIYDPEIPVNIVDLGLIYGVTIKEKDLNVVMTLTNPACPVADDFLKIVELHLKNLGFFNNVHVELVFEPPWTIEKMSEEGRLILGL